LPRDRSARSDGTAFRRRGYGGIGRRGADFGG